MKQLTVNDVMNVCNAKLLQGSKIEVLHDFSIDTRTLQEGDCYIGIKGEHFDGNSLYEQALEKGAKVCIVEKTTAVTKEFSGKTILMVEDTIKALQELATYKRELYKIPVIAITGSTGKTSTKDMIASVLSEHYQVLKTKGNYNNHLGVPLTILRLKEESAMVVEMGMNSLGEISVLTKIAKPTMCVITNVGTSHIGKLGSRENILRAKLEILEGMQKDGILIFNNDNDLLRAWNEKQNTYLTKTFGINFLSNVMAEEIQLEESYSCFIAKTVRESFAVNVPVAGKHFIYNSLCAIAVAQELQMTKEEIQKGIKKLELTKQRMDILKMKNGVTIINDCYNANYESMKVAIEYLASTKEKRKIALLGDMLELGEFSKELHEKVGEEVVKHTIDKLITIGDAASIIAEKAKRLGMKDVICYHEKKEAIKQLQQELRKGDIVLIKASNGMHFDKIVESLIGGEK